VVAGKEFDKGVLYQAKQYDIDGSDRFYHLLEAMHEKWRFQKLNASKDYHQIRWRFLVADNVEKFLTNYENYGVENFILMLRYMWRTISSPR
jgi:hypothetical protein